MVGIKYATESQNGWGWVTFWRSSCPTPQLKQDCLDLVAQQSVQMTFEYLQA